MGNQSRKSVTFKAGGESFKILKSRLKEWISLDEIQEQITKSPSADGIYAYLSKSTGREKDFWDKLSWIDSTQAYRTISRLNKVEIELPMLENRDVSPIKPIPWDYIGRGWYVWLNMFSKAYTWSAEYVAELEVEDAFGLFQELEVDRQLEREWEWQLTELAYPYNSSSKKSEFHPLPRPSWMKTKAGPPKASRIRRELMPVGNVIDLMHNAESITSV